MITLKFEDLSQTEAETIIKAQDWKCAMIELDNKIRNMIKYGMDDASDESVAIAVSIREMLYEALEIYDLSL